MNVEDEYISMQQVGRVNAFNYFTSFCVPRGNVNCDLLQ